MTYQKALDFVCSKPCIDSVMIGFGSRSDIDDIVSYMDGEMRLNIIPTFQTRGCW
ncbi:MAG: hypothetical protein ACLTK0_04525 [Anaerovoracaceae bacterium]